MTTQKHLGARVTSRFGLRGSLRGAALLAVAACVIGGAATTQSASARVIADSTPATIRQWVARGHLTHIRRMRIRLLGDAVLQRRAWELADQLGWSSTYDAEYVALTQLQADAFVTLDAKLARSLKGIVATAAIDALR